MREDADPFYRHGVVNYEGRLRELRVRYLTGEIEEDLWKSNLQRFEKEMNFQRAVNNVLDLYVAAARDTIRQILNTATDREDTRQQIAELVIYCNNSFAEVSKRFGRKIHPIDIKTRRY